MAPGPQLAAALSGIDVSRVSESDCVEVLKAHNRQLNHDRARLLTVMAEVGVRVPSPDDEVRRTAEPDEFAADEIRAALALTRRAADNQLWLAWGLRQRLPAVLAAMHNGTCDEPRSRILLDWTMELTNPQARAVCDRLLPQVDQLTTGQLIERVKKLAIAIDPQWARRRYEQAVTDRKVVGSRNPDGSANLSGHNLPLDRVADASARIEALARAAKRAGHPDPVDHVRADLYLGLLDGAYTGLDDGAVLARLLVGAIDEEPSGASDSEPGEEHSECGTEFGDESGAEFHCGGKLADTMGRSSGAVEFAGRAGDPDAAADALAAARSDGDRGRAGVEKPADAGVRQASNGVSSAAAARGGTAGNSSSPFHPRSAGVELRVRLSTLLGRDDHPAELAGWGPIHAEFARDLIPGMLGAEWRYVLTDSIGRLLRTGLLRARPGGARDSRPPRSGGAVELQVAAAHLAELNALVGRDGSAAVPRWVPVLAELTRHAGTDPQQEDEDADRRTPGAALRRYLQIRDRRCVGPGCRAPARTGDIDHTVDYSQGGSTAEPNLSPNCRHDHRLQHEGGWQLRQPEPGRFVSTSRLGHTYSVRPAAVIEPLPDPMPSERPHTAIPRPPADCQPIFLPRASEPVEPAAAPRVRVSLHEPGRPARPPPLAELDDDPPPF